jgi:hypothetical protein
MSYTQWHFLLTVFASNKSLLLAVALLFCSPAMLLAQGPAGAGTQKTTLPDSPQPKQEVVQNTQQAAPAKFVGYMTNRSIVFPDIATSPGPLTFWGKGKLFVDQSISPAYITVAVLTSAVEQARDVPKGYGQGWDAYGDRFGSSMARASSNAFFTTWVFPSVLHQDPRFFPQSNPTLWGSIKYSVRRIVITPTDRGGETFNASEIVGTLASETLTNAYYPKAEQNGRKTGIRIGTDFAWKFVGNMFKNYWPTFFHDMGLNRLKVIPDPGSPPSAAARL